MAGMFGAWVAAVTLAFLGERLGKRGSSIIAVLAFFAVSAMLFTLKLFEPLTAERLRHGSREARDLFELTLQPIPSMLIGACLVLAVFGPFVAVIRGATPDDETPPRRAPEF